MAGKKRRYEYKRELKKQSPEIRAMIAEGAKADERKAAAKKVVAKKKELTLLQKTKQRLKWVFHPELNKKK